MKPSTWIMDRLREEGVEFKANDNIAEHIKEHEWPLIWSEVREKAQHLLDALIIDTENDHNTKDTAERMARMFMSEVFKGRYQPPPSITDFPNAKALDEIYTLGPITIRSTCSHHFVPIMGKFWVGVIPSERVIGISKFVRLADWVMSRPHIQEEAAIMLADEIEDRIKPKGLALVMDAQHHCMTWRGVREVDTTMGTSIMRGVFRKNPEARAEFMKLIESQR